MTKNIHKLEGVVNAHEDMASGFVSLIRNQAIQENQALAPQSL